MPEKTVGLIAAPPTPMAADGELDLDRIEAQAEFLARNGVAGGFVCGTTGEGMSLTVAERLAVAERWVRVAPEGFRVIVHAGHTCVRDAQQIAAHAQKIGAAAVGAMPSIFHRAGSMDELVAHAAILAAAAPEMPFYYYHFPAMTNVDFPMVDFLRAAADRVPNLAGLKFTHSDLMDYAQCLHLDDGRFDCLFGRDEFLLAALSLGATGAIGSTYNLAAPLYLRIIEAFGAGDVATARALQLKSMAMIDSVRRHSVSVAGFKQMMAMVGMDVGPARPPLRAMTAQQEEALRADLERVGFFEFCSK